MASLIEELRKLPAKVRIAKIKELRKRLLWLTKDEEDKRKKEEEEELTRAIEEIELEQEEEELKERQEEERLRAEPITLEEIAQETPAQKVEEQREYLARQPYQTQQQAPRPVEEIHNVINRSHEVYHNLGRLPEREAYETRKAEEELMHKKQAGYVAPNERVENMMHRAEEMLDELKDPLKRTQGYRH